MQDDHPTPTVLAVLVVRNGEPWIRQTLASLARQTYQRLGVLAVDNASTDGSADVLERVLGPRRVVSLDDDRGFPGAVRHALERPAATQADFVLLLHDDVALDPGAVERMVAAAGRHEDVGIVGPKVVDWNRPEVLREVGFSADRFGYPHSPLEEGELDQEQYDAPREVLFVSSAAMLIPRAAWSRVGFPDDRLTPADADLDYGWRMRVCGFRVVVAPDAVVRHRAATAAGVRDGAGPDRTRYRTERAALVSVLKNCRLVTLLWVLPLYAVQGLGRLLFYLASRRFERAGEVLAAWGWNVAHVPGTVRRRFRTQSMRRIPDRAVARYLVPATARLTRWAQQASSLVLGRAAWVEEGEELEAAPLPKRVASVVAAHPVAIASIAAVVFTLVAFRGVLFVPRIEGGALPVFPDDPADFFRAIAAPWRSTGFGGPEPPSPALIPLGVASFLTLGSPDLLARLLVALTPVVAGVSCHVALRRLGARPGPAVVGGISYALSALVLWSASEGRIAAAVLLVSLPWLSARLVRAFSATRPSRPLAWVVGTGMALALAVAFFPAIRLSLGLVLLGLVVLPEPGGSRPRGTALVVGAAVVAAALVFPLVVAIADAGTGGAAEGSAVADILSLVRSSPGPAPGAGPAAAFLPVAGLLGFALAEGRSRRAAWRALITVTAAVPLAWLATAGRLPPAISNPVAFLAAGTVALSFLVGLGAGDVVATGRRAAFGLRQVVGGLLVAAVVVGAVAQAVQALTGTWGVGEDRLPPAWPAVAAGDPGVSFRVLWLGPDEGRPFPPPGGDPDGRLEVGGQKVTYGVTGRRGRTIAATGLPAGGQPYRRLEAVLGAMLTERVRHGGGLLAPFAVRYVVTGEDGLPGTAAGALAQQLDLDLVQRAGGLAVYRNARFLPKGLVVPGFGAVEAARATSLLAPLSLDNATGAPLTGESGSRWTGEASEAPSLIVVADRFDPRWRAGPASPFPAFGWAVGFEAGAGRVEAAPVSDLRRPIELATLAVLWLTALWIVRRRSRDRRGTAGVAAVPAEAVRPEVAGSRR
jgi:GT2 family glycosyltransferase